MPYNKNMEINQLINQKPTKIKTTEDLMKQVSLFDYYLESGATKEELAGIFRCEEFLIDAFVQEFYDVSFEQLHKYAKNSVKAKIKRVELDSAVKGDSRMIQFLGKNYLQQSDNLDDIRSNGTASNVLIVHNYKKEEN